MNFINLLLDTTATPEPTSGILGTIMSFLPFLLLIPVFYFFMYRPQKKQEKETANMRANLKVGDEITTIGGIIGKIVSIKDETCVIETTGAKTKIRILLTAVRNVDVHAEDADN